MQLHLGIRRIINTFLMLIGLLSMVACTGPKPMDTAMDASSYVAAFPSKNLPADASLRIEFNLPLELLPIDGDVVSKALVQFDPEISGTTFRQGESILVFQPDKPLEHGQQYDVTVHLDKLFNLEIHESKTFSFSFDVMPLLLSLKLEHLAPYVGNQKEWNRLEGTVLASDRLNTRELEKILIASQNGKELTIRWLEAQSNLSYPFAIDSVQRMIAQSEVVVELDGRSIGADCAEEKTHSISPIDVFELKHIKLQTEPDQYVRLQFSDPIDQSQNLDGLIYFEDQSDIRIAVENNTILIYPLNEKHGDQNIIIKAALKNNKGKQLQSDAHKTLYFSQKKPEVKFSDAGVIMPGETDWLLPFEAVNLSHIDVLVFKVFADNVQQFLQVNDLAGDYQMRRVGQLIHTEKVELVSNPKTYEHGWNSYAIDLSKMIAEEQGAIYRIQIRFKKEYALYDCEDEASSDEADLDAQLDYGNDYYLYDSYYYPNGFRWHDQDNPCTVSYYYHDHFVEKNVMASNLGLVVKDNGENNFRVFTNNIKTNEVLGGVSLFLYDYQQRLLSESKTDSDGEASLAYPKEPWLLVARKGSHYAYLRLDGGSSLSYSKFDVKGSTNKTGIKGFLYGERGVWRPGDSLFLTLLIHDQSNMIPTNHPATLRLYDPKGKEYAKKTLLKGHNGFYVFKMQTTDNAATGLWKAVAEIGGVQIKKRIRIENVKPNRLKISLTFNEEILGYNGAKAKLHTAWLHGGKASNLEARVQATLRSSKTIFKNYEDYDFDDWSRQFYPDERTVFDGKLDQNGDASFDLDLPKVFRAPGMLQLNFVTKVFEKGGDFSTHQETAIYAPYDNYVGLAVPEFAEASDYFEVDKPISCKVVCLSKNGKPLVNRSLQVEVYKLDWSWWYSSNNANAASYVNYRYDQRVFTTQITTAKNGEAGFDFSIAYPNWGRFYVRVIDEEGGHSCGQRVYVDWPSSYSRDNREGTSDANLLSMSCDSEKYQVGDTVGVSLPTPTNARILLSLEKNDKVLKSWWVHTTGEETRIQFEATAEMAPNIYLSAAVLQAHDQNTNDLPIRMYGVIPIFVENPATVLNPMVKLPEKIRPESTYTVEVSEKNGRKMTYTIAVVDDGLLDLTRYKTPRPHKWFYARESLAVRTWDLYDRVMGAFGGRMQQVMAIGGGDEAETDQGKKKANRFKPVVSFLGPFSLEEGETAKHNLIMPNYVGSVRCMVVAADDGAFGTVEKTVAVKQPLMVLAGLPRVLAPSEKLMVPVTVFAMEAQIGKVMVSMYTNELLEPESTQKEISFDAIGEKILWFNVDVSDKQGIAKMDIKLSSESESASYQLEVEVRNPNHRVYTAAFHMLKPGEVLKVNPKFKGAPDSYGLQMNVSAMPAINLDKRLQYLIRYPYGCLEQTTSSVFPQLYLNDLLELNAKQKKAIEQNIKLGIQRISSNMISSGAFSYWPGGPYISSWACSYAGHFLILAKEKGYLVSTRMLNDWISYQTNVANRWVARFNGRNQIINDLDQAYRLYTLALAGSPNTSAMNRMAEQASRMLPAARYRLAAAYALINQDKLAGKLLRETEFTDVVPPSYWTHNYGSQMRDQAMMLESMILLEDEQLSAVSQQIADALKSDQWMSTQTTAFCLYSMALLAGDRPTADAYTFKYDWNGESSELITPKAASFSRELEVDGNGKLKLDNEGEKDIYITITTSAIPELGDYVSEQNNIELSMTYMDMNNKAIDISKLKHGLDFYVAVEVKNPGQLGSMQNLALSQVFPSGWEIINTRMLDLGAELKSSKYDHIDFRDDRVDVFFDLRAGEKKQFYILLNAAYKGEFFMPPTQCKAMYNNSISATIGGGWVKVK